VKRAIREPCAWPGGYPLFIVMDDGATLSTESARQICASTIARQRDGWCAEGVEINWEDGALFCDHSGERIPSAYAEDGATETEES
jgi:hypothetical protein